MNRRTFLQAATAGSVITPTLTRAQDADGTFGARELVIHTVHDALRTTSPLLIYSGLRTTRKVDPLLAEAAGGEPATEVWEDWNDRDLNQVFGAFTIGTSDVTLGTYRIFDTPDIAHGVHQPVVDEIGQGYILVGGLRASRMEAGSVAFASMRLWNVIIDCAGESDEQSSDVMLGMIKHLGRAIGAID